MAGGRGKTFQKSAGDKRANLTFDVPNMVSAYSLAPVFAFFNKKDEKITQLRGSAAAFPFYECCLLLIPNEFCDDI